ncbi:DNA repair-scaffolding protein [Trichoplax sp. H2]|nr:DNA repair-scaffolding protein [Trichoplax sp. H2]|eukprot:RDD43093.1 DNA repair-scaffolding protein [Trichoplax sp. H2]
MSIRNHNRSDQFAQNDNSDDDYLLEQSLVKVEADLSKKNSFVSMDDIENGDDIVWSDGDSLTWPEVEDTIDNGSDILVAEALDETKAKTIVNSSQVEDIYDFDSSDDEELVAAEEEITGQTSFSSIKSELTTSSNYKTPSSKNISSPSSSINSIASSSPENVKTNVTSTPLLSSKQLTSHKVLMRKRKASEFIKELTSRDSPSMDENFVESPPNSVKKKRRNRHISAGFAEQLQKLITSQNLEINFWNHRKNSFNEKKSSIEVQILTECKSYGLSITFCNVVKHNQIGQTEKDDDLSNYSHVIAIFTGETKTSIKYKTGDCVEIFEPWQRLDIPAKDSPVLICTYFGILSNTKTESIVGDGSQNSDVRTAVDIQKLLNSSRSALSPDESRIPLSKDLRRRRLIFHSSNLSSIGSDESKAGNEFDQTKNETRSIKSSLTLVTSSDDGSLYGSSTSLHAAIESSSLFKHPNSVSFIGRIQRICSTIARNSTSSRTDSRKNNVVKSIIHRASSSSSYCQQKWMLIVQDLCGTFTEIIVDCQVSQLNSWHHCLREGEGKCFKFSNLDVANRTNSQKSPVLFSLLKSLPLNDDNEYKNLQNIDNNNSCSNCYILTARAGESSATLIPSNEEYLYESITASFDAYSYPKISSLYSVKMLSGECQRVSTAVKVVYIRHDDDPNSNIQQISSSNVSFSQLGLYVYATDSSILSKSIPQTPNESNDCNTSQLLRNEPIVMIHLDKTVVLLNSLVQCLGEKNCLLYIKDLCIKKKGKGKSHSNCNFFADRYSIVCKATSEKDVKNETIGIPDNIYNNLLSIDLKSLPRLQLSNTNRNLVCIEGQLLDLDKESIKFYFHCMACKKKNFIYDDRYVRRCHKCKPSQITCKLGFEVQASLETEESIAQCFDLKMTINDIVLGNLIAPERLRSCPTEDLGYLKGNKIGPLNGYVRKKLINKCNNRTTFIIEEIALSN